MTVGWAVTNAGNGVAASPYGYWYDAVYVSTVATISGAVRSQFFTESWSSGSPLGLGGVYRRTNNITLPQQSGTYYLVFSADDYNYLCLYEGRERNDVISPGPLNHYYQLHPPDLTPLSVTPATKNVAF